MHDLPTWLWPLALLLGLYQLARIHERLRQLEAQLERLLQEAGVPAGEALEPSDAVKALARDPAQRIEAIRAYRRQTGLGLREARAVIDRLGAPPA